MFDDLLIEKILTFCPKARFINKQFMKNYSYVFNKYIVRFEDMMTAFYCLLHGTELHIDDFYSLDDEDEDFRFTKFTHFMMNKLKTLSDAEKIEFATNAKKIYDLYDNYYDSLDMECCSSDTIFNAGVDLTIAHSLFNDVIKEYYKEN